MFDQNKTILIAHTCSLSFTSLYVWRVCLVTGECRGHYLTLFPKSAEHVYSKLYVHDHSRQLAVN